MESLKYHTEKLCSFYVSDWHLVTMILPYISRQVHEEANITTILEQDIKQNIETLISKLNLKNEKEILKINWEECKVIKYSQIDKKLQNIINSQNTKNIILINGKKSYIDMVNANVDKWITSHVNKLKSREIKIINCYEVTDFNSNIREILDTHDRVLNTSGEKYISEVFDGYQDAKEMC